MKPPPPEHRRFQFTLLKLLAFMLLCALFFAYTAWWMGWLRREQEKTLRMVRVVRQQEREARWRAKQRRLEAVGIGRILNHELRDPTIEPGALEFAPSNNAWSQSRWPNANGSDEPTGSPTIR